MLHLMKVLLDIQNILIPDYIGQHRETILLRLLQCTAKIGPRIEFVQVSNESFPRRFSHTSFLV